MRAANNTEKEQKKLTPQRPVYWKQVLVTTATVYPLLLMANFILKRLFPMCLLKTELAIFFSVLTVASLMVFPVMPMVQKMLGKWLYKR